MFAPISTAHAASISRPQTTNPGLPYMMMAAERYIFTLPKISNPNNHQPYYVSSGANSGAEGTVFPFYGISRIFKKPQICSFRNLINFFSEQVPLHFAISSSSCFSQVRSQADFSSWCRDVFELLNSPTQRFMTTPEESFLMDILQEISCGCKLAPRYQFVMNADARYSLANCRALLEKKFQLVLEQSYGGDENAKVIIQLLKQIGDALDAEVFLASSSAGLELRFGNLENLMASYVIGGGFWQTKIDHPAVQELKALLDSDAYFDLRSMKTIDLKEFERNSYMKFSNRSFGFIPKTQNFADINMYLLQKNALTDREFSQL